MVTRPTPARARGYAIPDWVPRGRPMPVICGVHFDAIRVPEDLGPLALQQLGQRSGPVVANRFAAFWAFLIECDSASLWEVPRTRLLRPGTLLALPPLNAPEGRDMHWAVSPDADWPDLQDLRQALTAPLPTALAPRRIGA